MAGDDKTAREQEVAALVQQAVTAEKLVVDDVSITPAGKRRLVRVLLDDDLSALAPDDTRSRVDPVSLDTIAAATRAISAALDPSDVLGAQPYVLEVSSPGTDRPLTTRRQFRRNVGRLVALRTATDEAVTGRLQSVDDTTVTLDVDGDERTVALSDIGAAKVQVEFEHHDSTDEQEK